MPVFLHVVFMGADVQTGADQSETRERVLTERASHFTGDCASMNTIPPTSTDTDMGDEDWVIRTPWFDSACHCDLISSATAFTPANTSSPVGLMMALEGRNPLLVRKSVREYGRISHVSE